MSKQQFPPGWDEERIKAVATYYETQSEEEALADLELALDAEDSRLMQVPNELVAAVRSLIEHFESLKASVTR